MQRRIEEVLQEIGYATTRFDSAMGSLGRDRKRYLRMWAYYSNPMRQAGMVTDKCERPYRQAQEWGMPERITGYRPGEDPGSDGMISEVERKEVVVENDIAWRIDTMIDYLFGRPPVLRSTAADGRRDQIQQLLGAIIQHNGGIAFLQQMALMGAVHGFVDIAVTLDVEALEKYIKRATGSTAGANTGNTTTGGDEAVVPTEEGAVAIDRPILELARLVSLQIVEPARILLLTDAQDVTRPAGYGQVYQVAAEQPGGAIRKLIGAISGKKRSQIIELWTGTHWWRWRDNELEESGGNTLMRIPVVHIQNTAVPFAYSGTSDVEPLIPLQDELNTRLSDRAWRIAVQSFQMYLGKKIDLDEKPPMPGRYWFTDVAEADVKVISGQSTCQAEDGHIAEVREALDKVSGVPPVAAGAIRNRIGNLTSAAALRITMMSLLARTERKRALYGEGLKRICEMSLAWLDVAGVFHTEAGERGVEVQWLSPLPEDDVQRLQEAKMKLDLGVGKEVVLRELGY